MKGAGERGRNPAPRGVADAQLRETLTMAGGRRVDLEYQCEGLEGVGNLAKRGAAHGVGGASGSGDARGGRS